MDNDNKVWIDREEYERLKTLNAPPTENYQNPSPIYANGIATPDIQTSEVTPEMPAKPMASRLTIAIGVLAIVSFIFPQAILLFLGLGIASIVRYLKSGRRTGAKVGVSIALSVLLIGILVVASPFIILFGFIIMFQIGCWTGLGSCTTA